MSERKGVSEPELKPEEPSLRQPQRRVKLLPLRELRQGGLSYYLAPHIDTPEEQKAREELIYLPGGR